jgi:dipeptidyl-peptidase-4
MKRIFLALVFSIVVLLPIYGQYFTVEDIELGRISYLRPATIENIQWLGNSDKMLYSSDSTVYITNIQGDSVSKVIGLGKLNQILSGLGETTGTTFPLLSALSDTEVCFFTGSHLVIYNIRNNATLNFIVPDTAGNMHMSPTQRRIAYTLGNNIYLQDPSAPAVQVTFDSLDGIKNGNIVYRNEFGIETGLFWSPLGNYLAYYRKDERGVSKYPLVDIDARVARYVPIRYPMAGMKSEETEVWIYSLQTKSSVKLQISGDREQYNTNISWTPDEKLVYIQHLNRGQDTMVLKSYDVMTGMLEKVLFTEVNAKYVEPVNPLVFSKTSPGDFFYQSERDGFNHIYYYSATKDELTLLTPGEWEVTGFAGTDPTEGKVYFMATRDSPLEYNLYCVDRKTGKINRLTKDNGTHTVHFNKKMDFYIDEYNAVSVPGNIMISDVQGNPVKKLLTAGNPILKYELGEVQTGTILAADDTTPLFYRLVKPVHFKASKKYPVVVYVYGGPHVQLITDEWTDRIMYLLQYLAQHDIASFVLDCRGSDLRGRKFEDVIFRQSGIPQLYDQMRGVAFLKSLPYIDTTRIGVHGWSYGGYMTLSLMVNYPGVFKVGVAGGPVTDWKYYEVMYGERYMDRPEENPEGYEKTSVLNKVADLQGKLLIIHGGIDPIVVPQNSLLFLQACIKNGKQVDYFVYPEHEHNVTGKDRVHLTRMITDYFIENL